MANIQIKCQNCGGPMEPVSGTLFRCSYCGNLQTQLADRETVMLGQAKAALRKGDFDEAEELFGAIIAATPGAYEAYWGRALARFGIVFVDDYANKKQVPTVHKMSPSAFMRDSDYTKAIANAPQETAIYYRDCAIAIEKIRTDMLDVARKELPYDIFICYKESDEAMGIERTRDSYECSDLYVHLTGLGYRVFFARESLRSKISEEFEPYIYNAIKTAKVMIVYGTKPEYIKAPWVRNEWSRYKRLIDIGAKNDNSLVVAVSQMSAFLVPDALRSRQCLDADSKLFYTDLDAHIAKVMTVSRSKRPRNSKFCRNCGSHIRPSATNCPACGASVALPDVFGSSGFAEPTDYVAPPNTGIDPFGSYNHLPPTAEPNQKPKRERNTLGVVCFVLSLLVMVIGQSLVGTTDLEILESLIEVNINSLVWLIASIVVLVTSIVSLIIGLKKYRGIMLSIAAIAISASGVISFAVMV